MEITITEDDLNQWMTNPVTVEVFKILEEQGNRIAAELANGLAINSPVNAIAVGKYKQIQEIINMTYKQLQDELINE